MGSDAAGGAGEGGEAEATEATTRAPRARTIAITARWDVRMLRILPFGPVGRGQYWWDACVPGWVPVPVKVWEAVADGQGTATSLTQEVLR